MLNNGADFLVKIRSVFFPLTHLTKSSTIHFVTQNILEKKSGYLGVLSGGKQVCQQKK